MTRFEVWLPAPPTGNTMARLGNGRAYPNPAHVEWLDGARRLVAQAMARQKVARFEAPVVVAITWHRTARRGDLDNRIKTTLDALKARTVRRLRKSAKVGGVIRDDALVYGIRADIIDKAQDDKVFVAVWNLNAGEE